MEIRVRLTWKVMVYESLELVSAGCEEGSRLGGSNSRIMKPKDFPVPVHVDLFHGGWGHYVVECVLHIFGCSVVEAFVCTFVLGQPSSLARAANGMLVQVVRFKLEKSSFRVSVWQGSKSDMRGVSPSAIDNDLEDIRLNPHGLRQGIGLGFHCLSARVSEPPADDEMVPVDVAGRWLA